jgi:hypothetical protein
MGASQVLLKIGYNIVPDESFSGYLDDLRIYDHVLSEAFVRYIMNARCGDSYCSAAENCHICQKDCGTCAPGQACQFCQTDCHCPETSDPWNMDFERGNLQNWELDPMPEEYAPSRVVHVGEVVQDTAGNSFGVAVPSGNYGFVTGFDGCGPTKTSLHRQVFVTDNFLRFDYQFFFVVPPVQPRTLEVVLKTNTGRIVKSSIAALQGGSGAGSIANQPFQSTGVKSGDIDLRCCIGTNVTVSFVWNVPDCFSGTPAFAMLDHLSFTSTPTSPANQFTIPLALLVVLCTAIFVFRRY